MNEIDDLDTFSEVTEIKHSYFSRFRKKWWSKYLLMIITTVIITFSALTLLKTFTFSGVKSKIAIKAVNLLYSFRSVDTIQYQINDLKSITTDEVFNQLTIDNEERRLNTYLKFEESASSVVVDEATEDYVIYHLDCETIEDSRQFIFAYHLNKDGKIDKVRECELVDFIAG